MGVSVFWKIIRAPYRTLFIGHEFRLAIPSIKSTKHGQDNQSHAYNKGAWVSLKS